MSDEKNIDKLFQSKLKGRQAAYSEGAWAGAAKMLDGHFKWLFIRRILYWVIPVTAISGGMLWVMLAEDAAHSNPQSVVENIVVRGSSAEVSSTPQRLNQASKPNNFVKAGILESNETALAEEAWVNAKDESALSTETSLGASKMATSANTPGGPPLEAIKLKKDRASKTVGAHELLSSLEVEQDINPYKYQSISNELATIKLDNKLNLMPLRTLDSGYELRLASDAKENPMLQKLRKNQLYAEGGLLAAKAMGTGKPIGFGGHLRLLLKYHLGESVYLDFGVGAFNRGGLPEGNTFALGGTDAGWAQVNPITINYASIYLGTGYRIGARHSVGLGFEVNPVLTVLANKQKNQPSELKQEEHLVIDKSGIANLDAAFVANYRFSFTERWDATSEVHLGFVRVTDNNLFVNARNNDRNTLLKLGLAYRLTNR